MSATSSRQSAARLPIRIIPTDDSELGENVARLNGRRLLVNVDAPLEDQLAAIADACWALAGGRSDWARPVRHLRLVRS